jgi:DUF2075 family protein
VTWSDVGEISRIKALAAQAGAEVEMLELTSQFRCSGADDYISWLDDALGVTVDPENYFSRERFDFRVAGSAQELHELIREKNLESNKARIVAGYCWDWKSKKDPEAFDIEIGTYKAKWNLASYGNEWIINPHSVNEVGCIHTCQGLEVDYIGVIIGDDLQVVDGELISNPGARARTDKSIKGYKKALKENSAEAVIKADEIIRNTYRTLMTRGMKGCYIYCTDPALQEYFKKLLADR